MAEALSEADVLVAPGSVKKAADDACGKTIRLPLKSTPSVPVKRTGTLLTPNRPMTESRMMAL